MVNPGMSCCACPACLEGDDPLCRAFRVLGRAPSGHVAELGRGAGGEPRPGSLGTMPGDRPPRFPSHPDRLADADQPRADSSRARPCSSGIGGGVAQAAPADHEVARAYTIVTSGSPQKLEAARALGADAVLDHAREDVVAEVKRLTEGRGADVVVDSVGSRPGPTPSARSGGAGAW